MNVCWIVLTDGRKQYISESLPTWIKEYDSLIDNKYIVDDSGNDEYSEWLEESFPTFEIVKIKNPRQGYAKAMQNVFQVFKDSGNKFALHLEDDFILHKAVNINDIVSVLNENQNVAQMSIMRQPWYHNEINSGGVIEALELNGSKFTDKTTLGFDWVEHRSFYTCNPNIVQRWVADSPWPDGNWTESRFGRELFLKRKSVGIWGNRNDWPHVEHIGRERNGIEY